MREELSAHRPVMPGEMLAALQPVKDGVYVDTTFGAGGYSRAILASCACSVIGIDRDPSVAAVAEEMVRHYAPRFRFVPGRFGALPELLRSIGLDTVDGIVFDIGVSSMQIDRPERGFSFQKDGPLDMRMSQSGETAADVVNTHEEEELADILYHYGEEKKARRIAKEIALSRQQSPITTTLQLASIVHRAVGAANIQGINTATRTFQALRIYVNRELEELENGLRAAAALLREGGRLVVVTFHSLEDRIVKRFLHGEPVARSRHLPEQAMQAPLFTKPRKQSASKAEIRDNPRARSSMLRAAERTAAPYAGGAV